MVLHFVFGVGFAVLYVWLWSMEFGTLSYQWGIMFGAIHGLIASVVIPILLHRFPRPNEMLEGPATILGIFVLHVIYGLIVAMQYRALVGD